MVEKEDRDVKEKQKINLPPTAWFQLLAEGGTLYSPLKEQCFLKEMLTSLGHSAS